jgi:hypothetical protein
VAGGPGEDRFGPFSLPCHIFGIPTWGRNRIYDDILCMICIFDTTSKTWGKNAEAASQKMWVVNNGRLRI